MSLKGLYVNYKSRSKNTRKLLISLIIHNIYSDYYIICRCCAILKINFPYLFNKRYYNIIKPAMCVHFKNAFICVNLDLYFL